MSALITNLIEWSARARFAIPVAVGLALVLMAVNEAAYQQMWRAVTHSISLTDARIEAAKALQAMTVMEAAASGAIAHDNPTDRQRFEAASRSFDAARQTTFRLLAQIDTNGGMNVDRLRKISDKTDAQFRELMALAAAAPAAPNLGSTVSSRAGIVEMQAEFDAVLARAAAQQQLARSSIFAALGLSRMAVHALVLLALAALLMFVRELRRSDAVRALEHERLATKIEERTARLRDLADHLATVREDERGRLARELHDEMGGLLTAMKLELARLRRVQGVPAAALERLASIDARLSDGIAFKRRVVENLRPSSLDQLGLKVALENLCADASSVMGVPVHVNLQDVTLGNDLDLTVFRIAQESLTNIAKYASANTVWVDLIRTGGSAKGDGDANGNGNGIGNGNGNGNGNSASASGNGSNSARDATVTLTVRDDGRGFDPTTAGAGRHGLLGMQVRVEGHHGTFRVLSRAGQGTQIVVTLPERAIAVAPSSA